MENELLTRAEGYAYLASMFRHPESATASEPGSASLDIVQAYRRLFLGPGRPVVSPYESVHLEGQLMGASAARVVESYAEANLRLSPDEHELPDHVSIELAFMAYLAEQEQCDPDQAEVWRERQRRFLLDHLGRWLPLFCQKVEASRMHPFYSEAAQITRQLVGSDMAEFLPSVRKRRYANICLEVDRARCTLCSLCTDGCPKDALHVASTPAQLSLLFDPSHCNGCRVCLRLCPEQAINLKRNPPQDFPVLATKQVVAVADRAVCPECHRPHVAEPWLDRLAERMGGGAFALHTLRLCPFCKVAVGNSLPVSSGIA